MELFTILLAGLLGILAPFGLITDRITQRVLLERLNKAEHLAVRVDNPPSHQLFLKGRAEKVRVAGRGVYPTKDFRIAVLEVETDPLDIDPRSLGKGIPKLDEPLQAGVRLVLEQKDITRLMQSPQVIARMRGIAKDALGSFGSQVEKYNLAKPEVTFLQGDRVRLKLELQAKDSFTEKIILVAETGLSVIDGHKLNLIDPALEINGQTIPSQFVSGFLGGMSEDLDLKKFESSGILARILKMEITPNQMELALFLRVDPKSPFLERVGKGK